MQQAFLFTLLLCLAAANLVAAKLPTGDLWQLFESTDREVPIEQSVPVMGTIPTWVDGLLLKNGFGKFEGNGFSFNFLYGI
jgi:hypothetical protein